MLINPLVYVSEGMRMSLTTGIPHMAPLAVYVALIVCIAAFLTLGISGFKKRVLS